MKTYNKIYVLDLTDDVKDQQFIDEISDDLLFLFQKFLDKMKRKIYCFEKHNQKLMFFIFNPMEFEEYKNIMLDMTLNTTKITDEENTYSTEEIRSIITTDDIVDFIDITEQILFDKYKLDDGHDMDYFQTMVNEFKRIEQTQDGVLEKIIDRGVDSLTDIDVDILKRNHIIPEKINNKYWIEKSN